jgi:sugar lactone lactonase YvrE
VWSSRDQCLWFVDIEARSVYRFDPENKQVRRFDTPGRPGFIVEASDGRLVLGMEDALYVCDRDISELERKLVVSPIQEGHRINDGYADAQGRLWFGTLNEHETDPTGRLFRCRVGRIEVADEEGYVVTNGPAMSPDGRTLYHSDSLQRRIFAFDVAESGVLSNKRLFVQLSDAEGYTDGVTVDSAGRVWIALFNGWGVHCYSAAGELVRRIEIPAANATKLAFGGQDLKTGYVTSARKGLSSQELQRQPLAGGLFSFRTDVPGQAANEMDPIAARATA